MARRRMRNGTIATDDIIVALAAEAEAGYAPEQVRSSRVGRPPSGDGFTRVVQFRVEETVFEDLLARAREEEKAISEIAREALVRLLRDFTPPRAPTEQQQGGDAEVEPGDACGEKPRTRTAKTAIDAPEQFTRGDTAPVRRRP